MACQTTHNTTRQDISAKTDPSLGSQSEGVLGAAFRARGRGEKMYEKRSDWTGTTDLKACGNVERDERSAEYSEYT